MTDEIPPLDETPPCACGARMPKGADACRKCAAVLRWHRRQARWRKGRGGSTRPAGRPRRPGSNGPGAAAAIVLAITITGLALAAQSAGVIWS
ncbi:hypothetical protein Ssi03_75660 [Sphaerisporangium siamense]|uniref:Uncharacterized protein n=1 Tax=Sphaerisporangium siamense TaxID=795645 RepID=A0A7W7G8T7_9ACTN|nr:hypothetical protein [Sphaerisporangium siamense]MBB4700657.1 hypothetical protein [Sphaerisporangium siamense]GII89576.1 hypothetical protein Ssi03_75660 [Sphaerisporangium siamense]